MAVRRKLQFKRHRAYCYLLTTLPETCLGSSEYALGVVILCYSNAILCQHREPHLHVIFEQLVPPKCDNCSKATCVRDSHEL